jgi:hypothetical protein
LSRRSANNVRNIENLFDITVGAVTMEYHPGSDGLPVNGKTLPSFSAMCA